jgi:hypothetical protein
MVRSLIGQTKLPTGSLVRTLNDHFKSELEPPDLRPSSNVDFPVAWITAVATDPSLGFWALGYLMRLSGFFS